MSDVIEHLIASQFVENVECEISNCEKFLSLIQLVNVRGKNIDLRLVAKQASLDEDFRRFHFTRQAYLREIYIYKTVLPCFELLQMEHQVATPFRSYPKYYASCDEERSECILLDNLKTLGYDNWNNGHSGLDLEHALLVCKNLGRLHALSFALRHHKPDDFDDIRRNLRDNEYEDPESLTSQRILEEITKRAVRSLDPVKDRDALESIACMTKHPRALAKTALDDAFHSKHAVVTHGDFWLPNILFRPDEVCLLDWQFARLGSPAFDVAQLLFLCCDHELRNGHYAELLKAYHTSLADFLRLLDADVHELFPYAVLLEHLKEYGVLALMTSFRVIYLTFLIDEVVSNVTRVTSDDLAVNFFQHSRIDDNLYDHTMRGIILDYIDFGYKL